MRFTEPWSEREPQRQDYETADRFAPPAFPSHLSSSRAVPRSLIPARLRREFNSTRGVALSSEEEGPRRASSRASTLIINTRY